MLQRCLGRLAGPTLIALLLTASAQAHIVTPTSLSLRPNGEDFIYVVDQGTCPATITATSSDTSVVQVFALNMNSGGLFSGNGASATVPNRVDQVFVVRAQIDPAFSASATITICWVGSDYPNTPCDENNCPVGTPVTITVAPTPTTTGCSFASGTALDPVNTSTRELTFTEALDHDLGGPLPLGFGRRYASRLVTEGRPAGAFGPNWTHNYEWSLGWSGNNAEISTPTGRLVRFERGFFGAVWNLASVEDVPFQLVDAGAGYRLADPTLNRIYNFGSTGLLDSVEDRNGNAHTLTYTGSRLDSIADSFGRALHLTYNGSNQLTNVSDGSRHTDYTYNGSGILASATDVDGNTTNYTYDGTQLAAALLVARTLPEGNTPFVQSFDPFGRVDTQTDAFGNVSSFTVGAQSDETVVTNALLESSTHTHASPRGLSDIQFTDGSSGSLQNDSKARRTSVSDTLGGTTSWTWHEPSGRVKSVTEANGATISYTYKTTTVGGLKFYDVRKLRRPDGSEIVHTLDTAGNVLTRTDPSGKTWTSTYNSAGQPLSLTYPGGASESYSYNGDGTVATATNFDGGVTTFGYDMYRRIDSVLHPDATSRSFTYNNRGMLLTVTDEDSAVETWTYDLNGNTDSYTNALGATWTFDFDAMDRLETVTDPLLNTVSSTFDDLGRLESLTNRVGVTEFYGYDLGGRLDSVLDGLGRQWRQTYDTEGSLISKSSPTGLIRNYTNDVLGRPTVNTSPLGGVTRYNYDLLGRPTGVTDALGKTTTFAWNGGNELTSVTLPGGQRTTFSHDDTRRLDSVTLPGGGQWSFSNDGSGRRVSETDPVGNIWSFNYGVRDRLDSIDLPGAAGSLNLEYNNVGLLTRRLYPDGLDLSYSYNLTGRLTDSFDLSLSYDTRGLLDSSNGIGLGRDAAGRLETVTVAPGKSFNYTYDDVGRVTRFTDWIGGQTTLRYDNDGRTTSIQRPNFARTNFEWNADGLLTRIFDVDPLNPGNLADQVLDRNAKGYITSATRTLPISGTPTLGTMGYSFDAASQVLGYTYDPFGRLTDDGARTFNWDDASRLSDYTAGGVTASFKYDGLGLRTERTEGGVTREFVWNYGYDRPSISVERQGGVDLRYYAHLPDGRLLQAIDAITNARFFYHYNEAGSVTMLTDDSGAVVNAYDYDPFGRVLASLETEENWFTYHGAHGVMREGDSGLYYMRARYYDASLQSFLSRDPIQVFSPQSANPYQFAFQNPIAYIDPSGMRSEAVGVTAVSVQTVGSEEIANLGGQSVQEFLRARPNLATTTSSGTGTSTIRIRGVSNGRGNDDVGVFIDGIFLGQGFGEIPTSVIDRVEVLRGPQGTLFGRQGGGLVRTEGWQSYRATIAKFRAQRKRILGRNQESQLYKTGASYNDFKPQFGHSAFQLSDALTSMGDGYGAGVDTWTPPPYQPSGADVPQQALSWRSDLTGQFGGSSSRYRFRSELLAPRAPAFGIGSPSIRDTQSADVLGHGIGLPPVRYGR